jgi:transketolase C-terminal domain/subunit
MGSASGHAVEQCFEPRVGVAQALLGGGVSCRSAQVGIADTFAEGASPGYLFAKYGLNTEAIVAACRRLGV